MAATRLLYVRCWTMSWAPDFTTIYTSLDFQLVKLFPCTLKVPCTLQLSCIFLLQRIALSHGPYRYGWMLEPKSSSLMPSAWAVSLLWEVTMPMTITATGKHQQRALPIIVSVYHLRQMPGGFVLRYPVTALTV